MALSPATLSRQPVKKSCRGSDSSVADHVIAWKLRKALGLDHIPGGVSPTGDDNLVIDITGGKSASGWGHAATSAEATEIVKGLPTAVPVAKAK